MFDFLLKHKDPQKNFILEPSIFIGEFDRGYRSFITEVSNGGFFFSQALVLYPHTQTHEYPDIENVNRSLKEEYGNHLTNLISFGEDIFGNQFCFDAHREEIVFFNIEDASKNLMGKTFEDWVDCFTKDFDYYSGFTYALEWQKENRLKPDQRLCPKKPFTIGGDYNVSNFYASDYPKFIKINASIAKQLHDLPDGTDVRLNIQTPE